MKRIYGFVRAHTRAAAVVALLVFGAESAFICWQKSQYEGFLGELLSPGFASGVALVTSAGTEDGVFERRDRLRVTFASSLYSSDPSAPPLTLDFDLVARFGPFGLTGDLFPLNATADSAKLLRSLEGSHPRLSIRWSHELFARVVNVTLKAMPFDMRLSRVKPGVGPISWRMAATQPVQCVITLAKHAGIWHRCTAPDLFLSFTDPAANISEMKVRNFRFDSKVETSAGRPDPHWYARRATVDADEVRFRTGDWRGTLSLVLGSLSAAVEQDPSSPDETLDGVYSAGAKRLSVRVTSTSGKTDRKVEGRDFAMKLKASEVPLRLFESIDDESIREALDRAGPMHFELYDAGFTAGNGQKATLTAVLNARRESGGRPMRTELALSADLPDPVMDLLETVVRGARDDALGRSFRSFLTPRSTPEGRLWQLRMRESRRGGVTERTFSSSGR